MPAVRQVHPIQLEGTMKILVACERSGVVRDAFIKQGHNAISCDLRLSARTGPHYQGNVLDIIDDGFDMMIGHPPCTRLAVSGALWFKSKRAEQKEAVEFFMKLASAKIEKICIENPVGIMSTIYRKPDQYIQPYEFGDDASKKTGLWLKGLPKLLASARNYVKPRMVCSCGMSYPYDQEFTIGCPYCGPGHAKPRWANQCDSGQNKLGPSPDRAEIRAKTYQGIANAMALQWG
jgi:hypothetical protein